MSELHAAISTRFRIAVHRYGFGIFDVLTDSHIVNGLLHCSI